MDLTRRKILSGSMSSALGLSMRSAITGLPAAFLVNREVQAADDSGRIMILCSSAAGEGANVNGPGTYEPGYEDQFQHPRASEAETEDVFPQVVNDVTLNAGDLENSAQMRLGDQTVRMARAYSALLPETMQHLAWVQHLTTAGIHPEYPAVLKNQGKVRGPDGRGSEELPSAIAQEGAALRTTTATPFVLGGGNLTYEGAPLARYSPTQAKTLAGSVGAAIGGPENFGELYDYFIDRTFRDVKTNGTAKQMRFLDQHASSRDQARAFGEGLAELLAGITDDSIESELRAAVAIAKLRLAPVVVTNFHFTGDNHSDSVLSEEVNGTLSMLKAIDTFWKEAKSMGVLDSVALATLTVFGRTTRRGTKGGRGHNGRMCSGLILGGGITGGVAGGIDLSAPSGGVTGINSRDGSSRNPDIAAADTLSSYYKTLMRIAGVSGDRRDVRIPDGKDIASI